VAMRVKRDRTVWPLYLPNTYQQCSLIIGQLLAILSVVTKIATAPEMPSKTHVTEKVRKRTDYRCSTSPGGIRVISFRFSQGKHYDIDSRIIN
jgi:hypothetical protein